MVAVRVWLHKQSGTIDVFWEFWPETTNRNQGDSRIFWNGCYMKCRALLSILWFVVVMRLWLWMECNGIDVFWEFCPETTNRNESDYKMLWNDCYVNCRVLLSISWFVIVTRLCLWTECDGIDVFWEFCPGIMNRNEGDYKMLWNGCYVNCRALLSILWFLGCL